MAYAEIIKEAKELSEESSHEVLDFILFLKAKEKKSVTERKSNLLKGGLKYMADDFDETPDCFNADITDIVRKE